MSLNDLRGTTSRTALIWGMTDSDQVGMQQARAPAQRQSAPANAEVLPDAGDGALASGGDDGGGDVDPETGLSGADLEAFRQMESGEPPPTGDDDGGDGDAPDPDADDSTGDADPAETPEPDPAVARDPAQPQNRQPPKTVNFSKHQRELKKANDRAAELAKQVEKERTDRIKLSERISIINEAIAAQAAAAQQQPAAADETDPNAPPANPFEEPDIDPAEDYAGAVQQERRRNRYAYEATQQTQTRVAETTEDAQMRETFTRDFTRVASTPEGKDLPAAYQFLKDQRLRQICLSEFDKDPLDQNEEFTPQEVKTMVDIFNAEEKWLVGNAIKQRKSPAAAILKQAKIYGFTPPAPAAPPTPTPPAARGAQPPARTNGAKPPAARPAPAAPSAAEALAELQAAQEAGKSLSDGGGAPPSALSAELLLGLDDEEFAEMVDSMSKHQLDTLMGRIPS